MLEVKQETERRLREEEAAAFRQKQVTSPTTSSSRLTTCWNSFETHNLLEPLPGLESSARVRTPPEREREFFIDNPLVRIRLIIERILADRPCAMGVLDFFF